MTGRGTSAGMVPVQRAEMITRDLDVIAELINQQYVEHQARFRCADPARVDAGVRSATAGRWRLLFFTAGALTITPGSARRTISWRWSHWPEPAP